MMVDRAVGEEATDGSCGSYWVDMASDGEEETERSALEIGG
jgi:hypothetical protein